MTFSYTSTGKGQEKELPAEIVAGIRTYLVGMGFNRHWTMGELNDALLEYQHEGRRLLLHQLAPIFQYLGMTGVLWPEPQNDVECAG